MDLSEEEDEFQSVVTQCLTVLLLGIETRLEGALAAMARINWAGMEMVGRLLVMAACLLALLPAGIRCSLLWLTSVWRAGAW